MNRVRLAALAVALSFAAPALAADSAVVLMYHRFGEDRFPSTSIRVEQFEAQLEHLRNGGFTVVPLSDAIAAVTDGKELPPKAVAITIDDAYRSVYEVAYPRFVEYGMPFTVFVATDAVDEGLPAYMSWDHMREMAGKGATYANHGATHTSLAERKAGESDEIWLNRVRADVDKGQRRLSEELEPLEGAFAYPYGEYDARVAEQLRAAGYVAFGQQSGAVGPHGDLRSLPRYPMAEPFAEMDAFRTKVASLPMPVTAVEPWDPVTADTQPEIVVSLAETDARWGELACYVAGQGRVEHRWIEQDRKFVVGPSKPLGPGRRRVNCTAPTKSGRYLWFSHPWIVRPNEEE
jgi:peptidoglycan/xylan/chitin deacetylase (PgdA/CDA1 family)